MLLSLIMVRLFKFYGKKKQEAKFKGIRGKVESLAGAEMRTQTNPTVSVLVNSMKENLLISICICVILYIVYINPMREV